MTGDNTEFVGNVTVDAGTLAFDSAQGASSDSFFGSDADITINQSGILYSNIDMAVNGNLKGDGTFKADNINLSVNGDNSGLANFTQTGGETTVASGGSLFKNNNITDGKVIFNENSFLADGSTFTTSNSVVEILNNSDANSIIGAVNNGTNSGLDLVLNNSNTTADLNIDGTNIETLTTQGNVTYGGILSGTGGVTNEGTLVLEGDASGFTGTFSQEIADTSTTVAETGKVFGGDKNINAGSLNITAESVNYNKVHLGSGAQLNHTSTGVTGSSTISESVVNFIDGASGANATFNNGNYTLAGAVDNGNANRVVFNNSDVILGDVTEFTGGTTYVLQNSDLDLSADGALKDYSFSNLETDGVVKIDINAEFVDEGSTAAQGHMKTDTLYVGNDGGNTVEFQIGNIFIGGSETGSRRYDTNKDVLDGNAQFDSDTSSGNVELIGATTSYKYSVGITDDLKSIFLETTGMTDNNTLYEMNKTSGGRFFQFSVGNTGEYHIDKSLSATAEGIFNVTGRNENAEDSVLSGEIVASTGGETVIYNNGSFFNIAAGVDTELNIKDLTIQYAYKDGSNVSDDGSKSANGAVIENNSTLAEVNVDNVIFQNNEATGLGGAIYNNGGTITVTDSIFTNNIATQGGAIFYAARQLNLANVSLNPGAQTGRGQYHIFNAQVT